LHDAEPDDGGQHVRHAGQLLSGQHVEEHDERQRAGGQPLRGDLHDVGRPIGGGRETALGERHAGRHPDGRDHGEQRGARDHRGFPGTGPGQLLAQTVRDDQLVRGQRGERAPHAAGAGWPQPGGKSQ